MSEALDGYRNWWPGPIKDVFQVLDILCPLTMLWQDNQYFNSFCIKISKSTQITIIILSDIFKKTNGKENTLYVSRKDDFRFVSVHHKQLLILHLES